MRAGRPRSQPWRVALRAAVLLYCALLKEATTFGAAGIENAGRE